MLASQVDPMPRPNHARHITSTLGPCGKSPKSQANVKSAEPGLKLYARIHTPVPNLNATSRTMKQSHTTPENVVPIRRQFHRRTRPMCSHSPKSTEIDILLSPVSGGDMSIGSAPVCDGVTNVAGVDALPLHGVYTGSGRTSPGAPLNECT